MQFFYFIQVEIFSKINESEIISINHQPPHSIIRNFILAKDPSIFSSICLSDWENSINESERKIDIICMFKKNQEENYKKKPKYSKNNINILAS